MHKNHNNKFRVLVKQDGVDPPPRVNDPNFYAFDDVFAKVRHMRPTM